MPRTGNGLKEGGSDGMLPRMKKTVLCAFALLLGCGGLQDAPGLTSLPDDLVRKFVAPPAAAPDSAVNVLGGDTSFETGGGRFVVKFSPAASDRMAIRPPIVKMDVPHGASCAAITFPGGLSAGLVSFESPWEFYEAERLYTVSAWMRADSPNQEVWWGMRDSAFRQELRRAVLTTRWERRHFTFTSKKPLTGEGLREFFAGQVDYPAAVLPDDGDTRAVMKFFIHTGRETKPGRVYVDAIQIERGGRLHEYGQRDDLTIGISWPDARRTAWGGEYVSGDAGGFDVNIFSDRRAGGVAIDVKISSPGMQIIRTAGDSVNLAAGRTATVSCAYPATPLSRYLVVDVTAARRGIKSTRRFFMPQLATPVGGKFAGELTLREPPFVRIRWEADERDGDFEKRIAFIQSGARVIARHGYRPVVTFERWKENREFGDALREIAARMRGLAGGYELGEEFVAGLRAADVVARLSILRAAVHAADTQALVLSPPVLADPSNAFRPDPVALEMFGSGALDIVDAVVFAARHNGYDPDKNLYAPLSVSLRELRRLIGPEKKLFVDGALYANVAPLEADLCRVYTFQAYTQQREIDPWLEAGYMQRNWAVFDAAGVDGLLVDNPQPPITQGADPLVPPFMVGLRQLRESGAVVFGATRGELKFTMEPALYQNGRGDWWAAWDTRFPFVAADGSTTPILTAYSPAGYFTILGQTDAVRLPVGPLPAFATKEPSGFHKGKAVLRGMHRTARGSTATIVSGNPNKVDILATYTRIRPDGAKIRAADRFESVPCAELVFPFPGEEISDLRLLIDDEVVAPDTDFSELAPPDKIERRIVMKGDYDPAAFPSGEENMIPNGDFSKGSDATTGLPSLWKWTGEKFKLNVALIEDTDFPLGRHHVEIDARKLKPHAPVVSALSNRAWLKSGRTYRLSVWARTKGRPDAAAVLALMRRATLKYDPLSVSDREKTRLERLPLVSEKVTLVERKWSGRTDMLPGDGWRRFDSVIDVPSGVGPVVDLEIELGVSPGIVVDVAQVTITKIGDTDADAAGR